jgi:ribosomal protein L11 methyltransferase
LFGIESKVCMTNWIEVSVVTDGELAEAIVDVLQRYGHQGVSIERDGFELIERWEEEIPPVKNVTVRAYFAADASAPDKQQQLRDALRYMSMITPMPEPEFRSLDDEDWAHAWKVHYKPVRLGRKLYICPQWIDPKSIEDLAEDDILIRLDPGMAFGTGTHPSTQLCMVAIEDISEGRPGLHVLDLGCGSGILSIAAAKLGASYVLGLDIEDIAITATLENAEINGVGDVIHAQSGSLDSLIHAARRFDVALVNILAKVIIRMCDAGLGDIFRPGGIGVFGGIIQDQAEEVEDALRKAGLEPYHRLYAGEWVVIQARKPE